MIYDTKLINFSKTTMLFYDSVLHINFSVSDFNYVLEGS
jgi:hypothetical protein